MMLNAKRFPLYALCIWHLAFSVEPFSDSFFGNNTIGPYMLKDSFLLSNTISVSIGDRLLEKEEYNFDYETSTLTFLEPIPDSVLILISYQKLPFALNSQYYLRKRENREQRAESRDSSLLSPPSSLFVPSLEEQDLIISGSKTLGFEVGTGTGLGLEQATRISLKGKIEALEIDAALSDQSSPIPPEGTTKEIKEFDRIAINVKSDNLQGAFGDYDFILPVGNFGNIERKVVGGTIATKFGKSQQNFAYSQPRGKYERKSFYGVEGKQGPYLLTEMSGITIVPGSEAVFLNGEKLVRGFENDYTIDYSTAELTFTNKRVITQFTRIEVAFEYQEEAYNRFAFNIGTGYETDPAQLKFQLYQETDARKNLSFDLQPSDIDSLSKIGDDTSKSWIPGYRYVGTGKGNYVKAENYFVYQGTGQGDYLVRFTFVGDSLGDYNYDEITSGFKFVGEKKGRYRPLVRITLPEKREAYFLTTNIKISPISNAQIEGLLTRNDFNLFSTLDDDDNTGLGYGINLAFPFQANRYGLSYQRKYLGNNFALAYKTREIDFEYRWDGIKESERRKSDEFSGFLKPFKFLNLNFGTGWLKTKNGDSRTRLTSGVSLFFLNYDFQNISETKNLRHNLLLTPSFKIFYPRFGIYQEEQRIRNLRRLTISPALQIRLNEANRWTLSYEQTDKETLKEDWFKESQLRIAQLEANSQLFSTLSLTTIFGYQNKRFIRLSGTDWHQYFARSSLFWTKNWLDFNFDYNRFYKITQLKELTYIPVEVGTGNYKKDTITGNFYPDPKGDYVQRLVPIGQARPAYEEDLSTNLTLRPVHYTDLNFYYNRTYEKSASEILRDLAERRAVLSFYPIENLIFRLGNTNLSSFYNIYYGRTSTSQENRNYLTVRSDLVKNLLFESKLELNRLNQIGQIARKETERKILFEPVLGFGLDLRFQSGYGIKNIFYTNYDTFELKELVLGMSRRLEIEKRTTIDAGLVITNRTSSLTELPYEISLTEPLGISTDFSVTSEYSITREVILSSSYRLSYPSVFYSQITGERKTVEHNFSLTLRAYF